jgi:type II secretory pathway pseudopilin PulG
MDHERGFTYIMLLIVMALMGVALAATGALWQTAQRREKERELLFIGGEFRNAIAQFAGRGSSLAGRYPTSLEDLLKDPRNPMPQRYLRKIYVDPITGTDQWGLVKGPSGEIYGVYSLSEAQPLKTSNFDLADRQFEGARRYADWVFMSLQKTHQPAVPWKK